MKKKAKIAMVTLLAITFTISLAYTLRQFRDYQNGNQEYSEAEALAQIPQQFETKQESVVGSESEDLQDSEADIESKSKSESKTKSKTKSVDESNHKSESEDEEDSYAIMFAKIDITALQVVNSDVIGWIAIPGTEVSYPLLQADDNEYYLKHTWKKAANSVGSIFLECQNNSDLSEFNTIIYGHNMRNGSMFGGLKQYQKHSYWEENPSIYIVDEVGVHRYDIFAAFEVGVTKITYGLKFTDPELKQKFIDFSLKHSVINTDTVPTVNDRIITLSTCTGKGYDTRWVVQAVHQNTTPLTTVVLQKSLRDMQKN